MAFITNNRRKNLPGASRKKLLALFSVAIICLIFGTGLLVFDPVQILADMSTEIYEGSAIYAMLTKDLEGVYLKTYLLNVTNAERFLSGEDDKLKVDEVGPFSYLEIRDQSDFALHEEDGSMTYSPKTRTVFLPEMSVADPKKVLVTMPNIAMLSMTSMISTHPYFTRVGYNLLTTQLKSKPIVTMTAYDYLWGYHEELITLGNRFLPGWISFGKMGILDRLYDNTVKYRINLGATNADRFEIKAMNGYDRLTIWDDPNKNEHSKCNTFKNAYEGIGYPNRMTSKREVRIYRNVLCRFLELDYYETRTMDEGSEGLVYKISNRTFKHNTDTECLCKRGNCIEGISDLSPCFYDLPLVLSAAHFTGANPNLYNKKIEGMKPGNKRHDSLFIIESKIGMALATLFSVQVNILMKDVTFNFQARKFSDMVVPVAVFTIEQPPIPEEQRHILRLMYKIGPPAFLAISLCLILFSIALLWYWTRLLYWNWISTQDKGMAFYVADEEKSKTSLLTEMSVLNS